MADVIGFCGKLLQLSVKCLVLCGRCNTGLRDGSLVLPYGQSSLTRDDLNDIIEFICIQ